MKGFTLIELMIVMAIIGILVAVAVPAYKKSRFSSTTGDPAVEKKEECVRLNGSTYCKR